MSLLHRHCFSWYLLKCICKPTPIHRRGKGRKIFRENLCFPRGKKPQTKSQIFCFLLQYCRKKKDKKTSAIKSVTNLRDLFRNLFI